MAYQPIVDLRTGRMLKVEALLRVRSPDGGLTGPADYLAGVSLAEMVEIGCWVRDQAFADVARLRSESGADVAVSVNLDAREVRDSFWGDSILEAIARAGLAPADVTVELTEGASFDTPHGLAALRRLAYAGVRVALDDVGTGFNALALLQRLPISELKVDRGFVSTLHEGASSSAIVRALVGIAHDMSLDVVAEGIETQEQLAFLLELDVELGQGYLFAGPAPLGELDPRFFADPGEAASLDVIRVMHLAGASPTTIAAALNGQGHRTPDGRRWHHESVRRAILRSGLTGRTRD